MIVKPEFDLGQLQKFAALFRRLFPLILLVSSVIMAFSAAALLGYELPSGPASSTPSEGLALGGAFGLAALTMRWVLNGLLAQVEAQGAQGGDQ